MITGKCYCGAISYEASDVLNMAICHCLACRKLTGGTAWAFLVVPEKNLKISGAPQKFSRKGSSGEEAIMSFCTRCGSTLFGEPKLWPNICTISASSLDDPSIFHPRSHVWVKEAPAWTPFVANIPQCEGNP